MEETEWMAVRASAVEHRLGTIDRVGLVRELVVDHLERSYSKDPSR